VTRFGIVCPELSGHLNPMMSLARAIEARGHHVTFYQRLISKSKIEAAGFAYRAFGEKEFPVEHIRTDLANLAKLSGIAALRFTIRIFEQRMAACLRDVPAMARADGIGAMLIDETTWEGGTIAEYLKIPFVTVSNAMIIYPEDRVPPFFTTWPYRDGFLSRLRNRCLYGYLRRTSRQLLNRVNDERMRLGLPTHTDGRHVGSQILRISQQVAEFDFPRVEPPPNLKYVGPMVDPGVREVAAFPFDRLDGKPLIYASMGTLQNRLSKTFSCIAAACDGIDAQLVISLGGAGQPESLGELPGNPIVVEFAPQLELIRRAKQCITHAGLNTVLESLSHGVPMVAIPITNDQPGVAARIKWTECGDFVESPKLNVRRLRRALDSVLGDPKYAQNARKLQIAIQQRGGAREAAELVEERVGRS